MKKIIVLALLTLTTFSLSFGIRAETVAYKFNFEVPYEKKSWGSKPKDGEAERASAMAAGVVWKKHLGRVSEDLLIRYEAPDVRRKIENQLDEIITFEKGPPQVKIDEKRQVIIVRGWGHVHVNMLAKFGSDATRADKSFAQIPIGFLILPREEKSTTQFDDQRESTETATSRSMQESAMRLDVTGEASNASGNAIIGEKNTVEISVSNSGSVTRIAEDTEYKIGDVQVVSKGLTSFFNRAGFNKISNYSVISGFCGGPNPDLVMESIVDRSSGDIPQDLLVGVLEAVRSDCYKGQFFISGTIDVDSIRKEQGIWLASALINIEVLDVRGFPSTFASVQSERATGRGPSPKIAKTDAVNNAIEIIGGEIRTAFSNSIQ